MNKTQFIKKAKTALKSKNNLKLLDSYQAAEYHLILLSEETDATSIEELKDLITRDLYLCNITL